MIKSVVVYLVLMVAMIVFGIPYYSRPLPKGKHNVLFLYCFFPSLLFAIVFGVRYGVGVDHLSYVADYLGKTVERDWESAYAFLKNLFRRADLHFSWFFGFLAFLQISFFSAAFKDRDKYPWLILSLFLGCQWWLWCNGIRQSLAACIFVFSTQFIQERKPIPYLLCVVIAFLFHRSAILLAPLYFIGHIDLFKNKWLPWTVFAISLLISRYSLLDDYIAQNFSDIALFFDYDYSADDALSRLEIAQGQSTGYGRLVSLSISCLILALAQPARSYYNNEWFTILLNLFLIGLFGLTAFDGSVILKRPFGYFSAFRVIIIAYMLFYLFHQKSNKNSVLGWLLIVLVSLTFIAVLYRGESNAAAYHTFWEYRT